MTDRKFKIFVVYAAANIVLFVLMIWHAEQSRVKMGPALAGQAAMVKRLGLSDLCLFTDARYTRHPSLSDLSTPFQDYPMSFEHFPSGSLVPPPPHLVRHGLD